MTRWWLDELTHTHTRTHKIRPVIAEDFMKACGVIKSNTELTQGVCTHVHMCVCVMPALASVFKQS